MKLLSVIVPCFNEEEAIPYFCEAFKDTRKTFQERWPEVSIELLFIDDGSKDKTLELIKNLSKEDKSIRYVSFSRNFGKEAGLLAGLEHARGDYLVCMDVDLQDPPSLLPDMFEAVYVDGYDSAATRRVTRQGEPPIRSFFARRFYRLMNKISTAEIVDGARDYRVMTRQMAEAILSMGEYSRFTKGIYGWIGFKTKWFEFENVERIAGETKWSFWNLFRYAIEGIVAFSTKPLEIIAGLGATVSFGSFIYLIVSLVFFCRGAWDLKPVLAALILLCTGVLLLALGIISFYLSKTYLETKRRPVFIVKEKSEE
ncbi:MAG: glycosyltransferase family 2 protein [Lachnospiraceae bacterium]|nr:glycosyltransferase family 2 protein [Lachnospiraceae bacterium]